MTATTGEAPSLGDLDGRTVYLAGPMRGYYRYNFDAFERGAQWLRDHGVAVVSPAEMDLALGFDTDLPLEEQGFDVEEAMRRDIEAILHAYAVVLLPGWERSSGTLAEITVAEAIGVPVVTLADLQAATVPAA